MRPSTVPTPAEPPGVCCAATPACAGSSARVPSAPPASPVVGSAPRGGTSVPTGSAFPAASNPQSKSFAVSL